MSSVANARCNELHLTQLAWPSRYGGRYFFSIPKLKSQKAFQQFQGGTTGTSLSMYTVTEAYIHTDSKLRLLLEFSL